MAKVRLVREVTYEEEVIVDLDDQDFLANYDISIEDAVTGHGRERLKVLNEIFKNMTNESDVAEYINRRLVSVDLVQWCDLV